jgi:hypothetical protein
MTRYRFSSRLALVCLPFALTGCGMFDWATANMPVIGQRCENWQCFTASGQQESKMNAEQRMHPSENPASAAPGGPPAPGGVPAPMKATAPAAPTAPVAARPPSEPLAPPMPENGAYVYVPRSKSEPGSTPFDGAMPAPVPGQ